MKIDSYMKVQHYKFQKSKLKRKFLKLSGKKVGTDHIQKIRNQSDFELSRNNTGIQKITEQCLQHSKGK